MEGVDDSLIAPANIAATDPSPSRFKVPFMAGHALTSSFAAPATEAEATTTPARLLESDPGKFRSLKQVIVIGRPGSGTDGVGDALKKLGFKVYDFQAASSRYERDFPLWLEAARLRQEGRPYNKSDYDKVIGDHDAIVGAPVCFFDQDFVKLYPNVKIILVTRDPNLDIVKKLLEKVKSPFWQRVDPVYYGNIHRFFMLNVESHEFPCMNSEQAVREAVRNKNLLVIHNLIAWVPLCEFLNVRAPDAPAPELHDNVVKAELAARPRRIVSEKAKNGNRKIVGGLTYALTMASITLVSALTVFLGGLGLLKLSSSSLQLVNFLIVRCQFRDVTRLLAAGIALLTLVCGFAVGYCAAHVRITNTGVVASTCRDYQHRSKNSRRRGNQGRGRQWNNDENARPERPTLEEWSGVQENIRRDDAEVKKEGRTTFEEWKNGKHVTFHVKHKQTESGQNLFSSPRKILSVTEETIE